MQYCLTPASDVNRPPMSRRHIIKSPLSPCSSNNNNDMIIMFQFMTFLDRDRVGFNFILWSHQPPNTSRVKSDNRGYYARRFTPCELDSSWTFIPKTISRKQKSRIIIFLKIFFTQRWSKYFFFFKQNYKCSTHICKNPKG